MAVFVIHGCAVKTQREGGDGRKARVFQPGDLDIGGPIASSSIPAMSRGLAAVQRSRNERHEC